jgi:hypothetical protein
MVNAEQNEILNQKLTIDYCSHRRDPIRIALFFYGLSFLWQQFSLGMFRHAILLSIVFISSPGGLHQPSPTSVHDESRRLLTLIVSNECEMYA